MSDPGVPTGDNPPRWTVNLTGLPVCLNADGQVVGWVATNVMGVYAQEVRDALVRVVRDAARVPALTATAQELLRASDALICDYREESGIWWDDFRAALSDLRSVLDLLTEAPDGDR